MIDGLTTALLATGRDVFAVTALLVGFQLFVLRRPIPHLKRVAIGFAFVVIGLAFFLMGLEMALFPLGKHMATELSSPTFVFGTPRHPSRLHGGNTGGSTCLPRSSAFPPPWPSPP